MAPESGNIRDMLDIIFQDRNRAYGAYIMRREYPKYMGRALAYGLLLIFLFFAAPYILNSVSGIFEREKPIDVVAEMGPPPDIDPNQPPPPPPPPVETPPPPQRSTVAFVPPVVKKDIEVPEEKIQDTKELEDQNKDISNKNVDGTDDAPPPAEQAELATKVEAPPPPKEDETIHDYVEKPPSFPGGEAELLKYLNQNIKYPALAKESNIQGRAILSFVVNRKGEIEDVKVIKDIGGGCGKEALRVVGTMPNWIPGEQNGHKVKVKYTLPVLFKLE